MINDTKYYIRVIILSLIIFFLEIISQTAYNWGYIGYTPKVGHTYTLDGGNPFKSYLTNTVLNIQGNYILYVDQFGNTNSSKIREFRFWYNKEVSNNRLEN